jgi:hypothetical protein
LPITEVKIADDAISAPKLQANSVIAGKIATDAVTTNTIEAGSITSLKIGAGEIKAINIEAGAVTANKIDVGTLSAITTNTGTLTSNLIRTAATGQRLEITDPGTDNTYSIWIGDSTKNDANGVFWVKHNGDVKINRNVFGIGAVPVRKTVTASLLTGLTSNSNGLIALFDQFPSNGQEVLLDVDHEFRASVSTTNPTSCPAPSNTTGTIAIQRSLDNGSTWSGNIDTATIDYESTAQLFTDPDPTAPDICFQRSSGTVRRALIDPSPPAEGTNVRYRVLFSAWSSFFESSQISKNEFNAVLTE